MENNLRRSTLTIVQLAQKGSVSNCSREHIYIKTRDIGKHIYEYTLTHIAPRPPAHRHASWCEYACCLGVTPSHPLATCALPKGVCYLLTYLLTYTSPLGESLSGSGAHPPAAPDARIVLA